MGVPQSGPGSKHLECRQMMRTDEAEPAWLGKGKGHRKGRSLRRVLWSTSEQVAQVGMIVELEWEESTGRHA